MSMKVSQPLTPEVLKALPIANENMSPDELRSLCLDFMRLQISFQWMPSQDYTYIVDSKNLQVHRKKGQVYGGIPYVNIGTGSLYRILEYYDPETGILDLEELGKQKQVFGNACSGCASSSWSRAISSAKLGFTFDMTQYNGFINVGPYQYPKDLKKFIRQDKSKETTGDYTPETVCRENGEQIMYQSYAATLPADGLLNKGHIRMVASAPTVFRNGDGTINGEKSFLLFCDQSYHVEEHWHVRILEDESQYLVQGGEDVKIYFSELFKTGYIPFTFAEFLGTAKTKRAKVKTGLPEKTCTLQDFETAVLESNYLVSDLFFSVKDKAGKELFRHVTRRVNSTPEEMDLYTMPLIQHTPTDAIFSFANGENTLEISCQLLNGEKPTVFSGTILK